VESNIKMSSQAEKSENVSEHMIQTFEKRKLCKTYLGYMVK